MGRGASPTQEQATLIYHVNNLLGPRAAKSLTESMGFSVHVYYSVVRAQGKLERKHPTKPKTWTEGQIEAACRHVETVNPHATLDELVTIFTSPPHSFPEISIATMWNYLDDRLFTVKQATFHNQMRNAPENLAAREEYARWFLENQQLTFLYIDECGYNLNTLRTQARARIGERAVVAVAQNKGTNISVCACVNKDAGLVLLECKDKAMKAEDFTKFLRDLGPVIEEKGMRNVCLVFDNCRIHSRTEIAALCAEKEWQYRFLPPYSPMLNIIEECFSVLKAAIKRILAGDMREERLRIASLPFGATQARRLQILRRAIVAAMPSLTQAKVHAFWNHMMTVLPKCLAREAV